MPKIIDLYVAIELIKQAALALAVLLFLAALIGLSQQLKMMEDTDASFFDALGVVFLRLPHIATEITFLYIFFGAMFAFRKLSISSETTVIKSVGYSGWRIIFVVAATAGLFAALIGPIGSPISSAAMRASTAWEQESFNRVSQRSMFSQTPSIRWISVNAFLDDKAQIISFRPSEVDLEQGRMKDVRIDFLSTPRTASTSTNGQIFDRWMLAETVDVGPTETRLSNIISVEPNQFPEAIDTISWPISLNLLAFGEAIGSANSLGLNALLQTRSILVGSGIPAPLYVVRAQQLLSAPALAFGAVLLASLFALRPQRHGRRAFWMTVGFVIGTNLYFIYSSLMALGVKSEFYAMTTIWSPIIALLLVCVWLISYLEDS